MDTACGVHMLRLCSLFRGIYPLAYFNILGQEANILCHRLKLLVLYMGSRSNNLKRFVLVLLLFLYRSPLKEYADLLANYLTGKPCPGAGQNLYASCVIR